VLATLSGSCGAGDTVKDGYIELQGDHIRAAERTLEAIGYKTKARGG
jgi:translation initiation factor 1 (eIF-1/SUI1)